MELSKSGWVARGIAFSVIYCAAYLAAWYQSLDQWFLPTGLRVAALLFLPYRYWPFLFLGDAAGLLEIRGAKAERYGELWAYLSPFLLAPMISVAPALLRTRFRRFGDNVAYLPILVAAISIWSSFCKIALNYALAGPIPEHLADTFHKYVVGDCLGMLIVVPLFLVWKSRNEPGFSKNKFLLDSTIAISMITTMAIASIPATTSPYLRQLFLVMEIVPAAGMTFLHGWRGAALGITATNLAIGLSLPHFDQMRAHDPDSFIAQQILVFSAMAFFALGAAITRLYDRARALGVAEAHALSIAQSSFMSTEHNLREKMLYMAQMQMGFDDYRKRMIAKLRAAGHYAAAMELNAEGVEQMALFERQSAALYPIQIERQGLYAALHAEAFTKLWAGETEVMLFVKGQPRDLSINLQIAAYRCICNAFALLAEERPNQYKIKARVWCYKGYRGIAVSVIGRCTRNAEPSSSSTLAALELEGRVKAYGGATSRRRPCRINFFVSEASSEPTRFTSKIDESDATPSLG